MHVEVNIGLLQPNEQGLTTREEADELNALEDELFARTRLHAHAQRRQSKLVCLGQQAGVDER